MKKKVISFVLIIAMLEMFVPSGLVGTTVFAGDDDFTIKNGVLEEYNGSGGDVVIPNSVTSIGEAAFYGCSSLTNITIPNSVTKIGYRAFDGCSSLTSITIPDSVTKIGGYAFDYCTGLTSISVESGNPSYVSRNGVLYDKNVTTLVAFPKGKEGSFVIPNSVTSIGESAFSYCESLTSVTIPDSVTLIGEDAFFYCESLASVTIGNSVTSIGEQAFWNCESLASVTIGNSVTDIDHMAFWDCKSLTSVTIPNSVTWMGYDIFEDCTSLTSLTIPNSVTSIGSQDFRSCTRLTDVYYEGSEEQWKQLSSVGFNFRITVTIHYNASTMPLSITQQPANVTVTSGQPATFSLTAQGEGLKYQWYYKKSSATAWSVWTDCTAATIEPTSDDTWNGMQVYCKVTDSRGNSVNSNTVTVTVTTALTITQQPVNVKTTTGAKVSFSVKATGSGLTYQWYYKKITDTKWNVWADRVKASTTATANSTWNGMQVRCVLKDSSGNTVTSDIATITIEQDDFVIEDGVLIDYNGSDNDVVIPDGVTAIGGWAFEYSDSMTSITIPNSVTSIGEQAFRFCENLKSITIPNSVTSIGDGAFNECHALINIKIPNSVTSIGEFAFRNCTSLKNITIPDSVISIGQDVFGGCSSMTSINVSEGNKNYTSEIGILYDKAKKVLICCPGGESGSITIPNSVTSIGDEAFVGCDSLTSITIPGSVTSIGSIAFEECSNLKDIYYAGTQQQWDSMLIDEYGDEINLGLNDNVTIHFNYVSNPLSIISHPANVTAKVNDNVSFSVKAQGEGLTYQWYYKKAGQTAWNKWGARTTATTTATANATWNGMQVYCKVTDKDGNSVDSNPATITIKQDLKITAQPTDKTVKLGESLTLSVKAEGIGLTYQWYYKKAGQTSFSTWNGRTHASETCTPNATWDGIQLYCIVKDSAGNSVKSNTITVTVKSGPVITKPPTNQTINLGSSVTLSLTATGTGLTYQWYFKKAGQTSFSAWNGRTHASETVTPNATWDGIQLYCIVKDSGGNSVKSNTVTVTVKSGPVITKQPTNQTISLGSSATLSLNATGSGLTYQWYYKKAGQTSFSTWNGRTHASETCTPNATWDGIQLYCIVKDGSGNKVQSNTVTVKVNSSGITITQQPQNQSIIAGKELTLSVKATGNSLKFQWYYKKKGQTSFNIWNGRTHATETVSPNSTWDGIQLYCKITDGNGKTLNSSTVTINVLSLTTQPSNVTVAAGSNATFKVVATGSGLKYQWQYKKSGQTSWSNWGARTTASTTATSNATWQGMQVRCIVTDSAGNKVTSNAATITIK